VRFFGYRIGLLQGADDEQMRGRTPISKLAPGLLQLADALLAADPADESHDEGVLWNAESGSHLLAGALRETRPVEPGRVDTV
jgi:hypothetical protein